MGDFIEAYEILCKVRKQKPLVHHITNWVTIYDCANVVRVFGALPVMAHAPEEVEEMTGIAGALVLNIGTLTTELIEAMKLAGKKANKKGIPVILDAVGTGATKMRTEKIAELLQEVKINILKGNAGEIASIAGIEAEVRGVESISAKGEPGEIAKNLAKKLKCVVVITGKTDRISNGECTFEINNGHARMGEIVGTGCMAASVIGAFAAVEKDYAKAATCALACFEIAGELAAEKSVGPGSFKEKLYDEIYLLDEEKIKERIRVSERA